MQSLLGKMIFELRYLILFFAFLLRVQINDERNCYRVEIALLLCQAKGAAEGSCLQGCLSRSGGGSEESYMFRL